MRILFLLFLVNVLVANEAQEENHAFLQNYKVTPRVNVITGEYLEEECDLEVAACDSLSFRRFYGHFASHDPFTNFWRFNPEHFCEANLSYPHIPLFVSVGQADGNIHSLDGAKNFQCATLGYVHSDISGGSHPSTCKITFRGVKEKGRSYLDQAYGWEGEIVEGTGSKKKFATEKFDWHGEIIRCEPGDDEDRGRRREIIARFGPSNWIPYHLPIYEEKKPNGNILCYEYEHFTRSALGTAYPKHSLLKSITLYNRDKTKIIGSLKLNYQLTPETKKPIKLEVVGSDNRKALFDVAHTEVTTDDDICKYFPSVVSPCNPPCKYVQEGKRLKRVERPGGWYLETEYHPEHGKVVAQYAPVGPKGKKIPIGRYTYNKDSTEVLDGENNKTIFFFDGKKRVTRIETYDKAKKIKIETFAINRKTGDLDKHSISDGEGKLYKQTKYEYDANHCLKVETIGDGKEEYKIHRNFTKDGLHLVKEEWDDHKKIVYEYEPGTNLCKSEISYECKALKKRVLRQYNDCAICVKIVIDDGDNCTYRKITKIKPNV